MKQLPKFALFLFFIYNMLYSDTAIAQVEENCPRQIYDTGLFLGWGSALLEYTQSREAPSPFDRIIIEQLQGANNSVERAARDCEPAIPAWPGWKQKQNYLLHQIEELQSTTNHNFKRGRVYTNINSTYYSWGADLSIMVFDGQTIKQTTCSTCYFRLGFSTAYAAQAFRQGEEALVRNNDVEAAKQQMKLAANYLGRTLKVLDTYKEIQQPRGSFIIRCAYLSDLDLENRITSLIRLSNDYNNVTECIRLANLISEDIKVALNADRNVNTSNSYEYCRSKYCPECDDQIVLLETAVNKDCQKCLDKHKDLIAKCMKNGSASNPDPINLNRDPIPNPSPVSSGIKCPLKNTGGGYLALDSNNNPNDKTQIKCTYSSNGLLMSQNPEINGKSHGEYIRYKISNSIHYIAEYRIYKNGIKDGVWKTYHHPNSSGKVVLASKKTFNNGVKILEEFYDSRDFLSKRIKYDNNGKKSEQTSFFPNGRKSSHITYTSDGKKSSHKGWYDDGRKKF